MGSTSKMMAVMLTLTLASLLSGCGNHVMLTDDGRKVRTISPELAKQCTYRGLVFSKKSASDGGMSAAQKDVRNRAAAAGGNAMVLVTKRSHPTIDRHSEITAKVYRCRR